MTLAPTMLPNESSGMPLIAEEIPISNSGIEAPIDITKKATMNSRQPKKRAILAKASTNQLPEKANMTAEPIKIKT